MVSINNLKKLSFLVYGLGSSGKSVVNFFQRNNVKNYQVWDDNNLNLYKKKRPKNLEGALNKVDHIVLSPGISLKKTKNRKVLSKYKKKIITDLDIIFLIKNFFKSIVITGTNGKSTTCKILAHILKKKYKVLLGGNIGIPILNLKIKKKNLLIIEASSFQLAYSKFIQPDYALLLNITNDHIDWHGNLKNYINSKFKIFENQEKNQYSIINKKFKKLFKKKKSKSKLVFPQLSKYLKLKHRIKNFYLKSDINNENMSYVFTLSKLLKINEKTFFNSLQSFKGLPHRYEIFLKKKNCTFINDSKATTFQASKFALKNSKNILWILGGQPKKKDKFFLKNFKNNIIKSYIIGKNVKFFKNQLKGRISYSITKNLRQTIIQIMKDIRLLGEKRLTILLSPASASFDQYLNFEKRGEEFKKLIRYYARRSI